MIFLFPAAADVVIAAAFFVCSNRLADAGQSKTAVASVIAAWAVVYVLANQVLGRFVTSRNAAGMLIVANLMFAGTAAAFVCFPQTWVMYLLMGILAVATSLFFLPFQIFMKAVEPDRHRGVVRLTALYTFSWSLGFAAGPFIAGFIYQWLGWEWCYLLNGVLGLATAGGVYLLKHHAKHHHGPAESVSPVEAGNGGGDETNYHAFPDLAWLGWVGGGVGCIIIFSILGLLPSVGVVFGMPKSQVGSIVAVLYTVQALTGLSFFRSRTWMFRALPVVAFGAFGAVGMAAFCVSQSSVVDGMLLFETPVRTLCLYVAAACYGVFSGTFFFSLVFHSLVHPERSTKYVAVNECVVGLCAISGPIAGGILADRFSLATPFGFAAVLIVGLMVFQYAVLRRHKLASP